MANGKMEGSGTNEYSLVAAVEKMAYGWTPDTGTLYTCVPRLKYDEYSLVSDDMGPNIPGVGYFRDRISGGCLTLYTTTGSCTICLNDASNVSATVKACCRTSSNTSVPNAEGTRTWIVDVCGLGCVYRGSTVYTYYLTYFYGVYQFYASLTGSVDLWGRSIGFSACTLAQRVSCDWSRTQTAPVTIYYLYCACTQYCCTVSASGNTYNWCCYSYQTTCNVPQSYCCLSFDSSWCGTYNCIGPYSISIYSDRGWNWKSTGSIINMWVCVKACGCRLYTTFA